MSIHSHISFAELHSKFRWNLVLGVYTKSWEEI